jgi:hypothetical protein
MDSGLRPYQDQASSIISRAVAIGDWSQKQLDDAGADLARLKALTSDLSTVAQHHSKLKIAVAAAAEHISYIEAKYTVLMEAKSTRARADRDRQISAAAASESAALLASGRSQEDADIASEVAAARKRAELTLHAAIEQCVTEELGKRWAEKPSDPISEADRQAVRANCTARLTKQAEDAARQVDAGLTGNSKVLAEQEARYRTAAQVLATDPTYSIGHAFGVAREALGGAMNLVTSFRDNPGRRLLSLLAGVAVGLLAAGALGFDIFTAILGVGQVTLPSQIPLPTGGTLESLKWGVVVTGIVIGLGAEPAHQVIKILQETKQQRELLNRPSMVATEGAVVTEEESGGGGARSIEVWQPGAATRGLSPGQTMAQTTRGPRFIRFY